MSRSTPPEVQRMVDVVVSALARDRPDTLAPPKLLAKEDDAVRRLGVLSLVLGSAAFLGVGLNALLGGLLGFESMHVVYERALCHAAVFVLSIGMFSLTRTEMPADRVRHLGLVYEVVGAWGVTLTNVFDAGFLHDHVGRVIWLCIWITLFPILLPSSTWKRLASTLLATSAAPGLLFISWFAGSPAPTLQVCVSVVVPPAVCACLAMVTAHCVRKVDARLVAAESAARRLGSYRLTTLLGAGGMGEVWRAEHRLLARPAAVKLIRADRLGSDAASRDRALARFKREAESLAALSDPHTVKVYDYGLTAGGDPYYVMELLDGMDLDSLVQRFGPVPPARAIHFLLQACSSLAEAHAAGLVHRDVKPANVYVCHVGLQHDFVKLLDFGLVGRLREDATHGQLLSGESGVGTPAFMAPEAVRSGTADVRGDIYSLACTAYWILTGSLVFDGEDAAEIMAGHLHSQPCFGTDQCCSAVPLRLEQLVLRCLAKSPSDRPQSIGELVKELQTCAATMRDAWTEEEAKRWWANPGRVRPPLGAEGAARCATISWDFSNRAETTTDGIGSLACGETSGSGGVLVTDTSFGRG